MSKGARIRENRKNGNDRKHTLVTKEKDPRKMHNPGNASKAIALRKQKKETAQSGPVKNFHRYYNIRQLAVQERGKHSEN